MDDVAYVCQALGMTCGLILVACGVYVYYRKMNP